MRGGLKGEGDGLLSWWSEDLDEVADGDLVRGEVEDAEASATVFRTDGVEDPAHCWKARDLLTFQELGVKVFESGRGIWGFVDVRRCGGFRK